jgi:hypothetical protein
MRRQRLLILTCEGFGACAASCAAFTSASPAAGAAPKRLARAASASGSGGGVEKTGGAIVQTDTFTNVIFKESFKRIFARDEEGQLRMAFNACMKDPAFIADLKRMNFGLNPLSGEAVGALVSDVSMVSEDLLPDLRDAYSIQSGR